jgi:hypothetical protein
MLAIVAGFLAYSFWQVRTPPSRVSAQIKLLACLQGEPDPGPDGMWEPLGWRRFALCQAEIALLRLAADIDRWSVAGHAVPQSIVLRGVARSIERFVESDSALIGEVPPDLCEALKYTVRYLAGPHRPGLLVDLAKAVDAFDADGRPAEALRGATRKSLFHNWASHMPTAVASTTFLRNVLVVIGFIVAFVLMLSHKLPNGIWSNIK